ncbi:MAG TPA: O-antigen ligase family protein [Candidatus Sulfotelmatobacter sp.]|nr:O-antigen ligase family protein [Candidatus Sulfotelmatobacter sp.]
MIPSNATAAAKQSAWSELIGSVLLYGTFGLLMFGPVAFGAVEPWSIFTLETGATLLALVWIAKQWLDGEIKVKWNPLFLPMGIFGVLVLLQIVFPISAYRHDTISHAMLLVAYAILCFLSTQTLLRGAQARRLALIFCIYGSVLAGFALLQGISPNGRLYWMRQPRLGGWIYGPYVNHNHYAGLMEMLIPIPLVLSLSRLAPSKERIAAATAAAVMAGTIFLSGSRGGMLALFAELVLLAVVLIKQRHDLRMAAALGLFLLLVVVLLTWLGGDELSRRLATVQGSHSDISNDMRFQINRDGLRMFRRHPVLGWGLGCFPVTYPQFRTFYTNFFVNQAHDDYLQLLVEMGLLGFGVMIWYLVVLFRRAWPKIRHWSSEVGGAMTLACVLGVTGILVHSAVDFNLEIPANAALFYVFCVVAASDPMVLPKRKRKPVQPPAEATLPASEVV